MNEINGHEHGLIGGQATAGKIAYDAYFKKCGGKSLASGAQLPTYDQQKPEMVAAWEAAGTAVVEAVTKEVADLLKSGKIKKP